MKFALLFSLAAILMHVYVINSQVVPFTPWPPIPTYNGSRANWTQVYPTNNMIVPREYQSVVYDYDNNRLIIFGGRDAKGNFLGDLWAWSFSANRFLPIDAGQGPSNRSDHIAGMDVQGRRMLLFGGKGPKGTLGDFWELSLISGVEKWTRICEKKGNSEPCKTYPSERWGAFGGSFVGGTVPSRLFFVSHGKSGFQAVKSDTWVYDMRAGTWKDISGEDSDQGRFVVGADQKSPSPRFGAHYTMLGPDSLSIYGGCGAGGYGGCPSQDGWQMTFNSSSPKAIWIKFPTCPIRSYNGQACLQPGSNTTFGRLQFPFFFGGYGGNIGGGYHDENILELYDTASTLRGSGKWQRTTLIDLRTNPLRTPGGRTGASMVYIHPPLQGQSKDFLIFFGGRDKRSTVRSDMWYLLGQNFAGRRFKCSSNINWRMIHGILMFVSFGVIFPNTMALARFGKDSFLPRLREKSPWLWVHSILNIFGCLVAIPGLVLAIVAVNTAHWTSIPHAYLGIIAFAFVMFEPIWGFIRPDKESDKRPGWAYVHLWVGRLAILLGFTTMMLGILMIRAAIVIFALYIVYMVLYFVIFIVLFLFMMKKSGDSCGKALDPRYRSDKYDY